MGAWLVFAIFLPVFGAALIWLLSETGTRHVRHSALITTLATLLVTGYLVSQYEVAPGGESTLAATFPWLSPGGEHEGVNVEFAVGLDGLSLWLFALTALLMVTSVLVSWEAIKEHTAGFYALLLLLESGMLGVFAARDIIMFYIFFEATLIPLFFLIGIWGGSERRYAAIKFFLFTFSGSVLTFLGLMAITFWNYQHATDGVLTFSIPEITAGLAKHPIDPGLQLIIFLALFIGFAIKVPLFPLHTWLPLAHVEAPTAGSILLAGILLKLGSYGFVRFSLPMLPDATVTCMPWILSLSLAGVIYGALVALAQRDIKRLIAYSSVSHLGYCMLGLFALNAAGIQGSVLQMVSHGLSTGGLFAVVGMLYERYHTRQVEHLGGLASKLPRLAFFMVVITFASVGLPGLSGFAGEFLLLLGLFQRSWGEGQIVYGTLFRVISVLAVLGIVLGAWYMLWLVKQTFFGPLKEPQHDAGEPPVEDLGFRETMALAPLVAFMLWIGLAPAHFLDPMRPTLDALSRPAQQALVRQAQQEKALARGQTDAAYSAKTEVVSGAAVVSVGRAAAMGDVSRVD